jgi:hypothetical protein
VTSPKIADGAVNSAKVAGNSLSAANLAPSSVGSSEIASNSVGAGDIGTGAVNGAELAANAVQGDEVENGSLDAVDVGLFSGATNANFPNIAADACGFDLMDPSPGAANIDGHAVLGTPSPGFFGNVSFHAEAEGTQIRIKACNSTGLAIDPDGAGASYAYIVFRLAATCPGASPAHAHLSIRTRWDSSTWMPEAIEVLL